MSNIRIFIPNKLQKFQKISLSQDECHYLIRVMKIKNNTIIKAFNVHDGEWNCYTPIYNKERVTIIPFEKTKLTLKKSKIILAFSLIKRQNISFVIQKATELNIKEIHPLIVDRSVVKTVNLNRLHIIAKESSEQCGRLDIPKIHVLSTIENLVKENIGHQFIVCHNCNDAIEINLLNKEIDHHKDIIVLIGPEGGFSNKEISYFKSLNLLFLKLSHLTLRAETAALVAISNIQNFYYSSNNVSFKQK